MSFCRVIFPKLLHIQRFTYPRAVHLNSSVKFSLCVQQRNSASLNSHTTLRMLCTEANPDLVTVLNKNITSKMNISKQIIVRGKAATNYQKDLINEFLVSHETATPKEWHELITKIFKLEFGMINEINIDGKIVDTCTNLSKLELSRSYLTYMKSQKKKFNGAVVAAFIKVCFACREFMTEQDKTRIKQFTDFLQKRYTIADSIICDGIVKGLLLQMKIDEALEVRKKTETLCKLSSSTYSAIAISLIQTNQFDMALNYMKECIGKTVLQEEVFLKGIDTYKNDRAKLDKLIELFIFFDIKPSKLICDHLIVVYKLLPEDERLIGAYGTINNRGKCSVCGDTLEPLQLEKEEFDELRDTFLDKVLVGGDIFKNTTPQELNKFFNLVKSQAPFDVVIDGLNVAFMIGTKTRRSTIVKMIEHVVTHFREQDMKILLIGRKHMKNLPNFMDVLEKLKCNHFLIDDLSEDDPFLLYATMYSGIHTNYVTRDLMRHEKYVLQSDKCKMLFNRWQRAHQIFISYVSPDGRVYSRTPFSFQMNVQRGKDGDWHIPYVQENEEVSEECSIHPKWLCLQKPSKLFD